ncbi:MAG TPA: glycosyltransferase [Clostridia bacterium]|nr:glycosyltransferase [Clostridia bacterium]
MATALPAPELSGASRRHVIYLAIGFPPAAKSSAYRMRATANQFSARNWDVTVINICQEAWQRESGLDHSLSAGVDPRVKVIELPLVRQDLETDIRAFSEDRALDPPKWVARLRSEAERSFPEPVFGGWRGALEEALLRVHRDHPADLLVTTCAPYVNLAATWRLWLEHRVPYIIDFRDGWSIDVIGGGEAFSRDSVAGQWEERVLGQACAIWTVNDPIAEFYRERYPDLAERVRVVRNGVDPDSIPRVVRTPSREVGFTFGFLGTANFPPTLLEAVLAGWREARSREPLLSAARFEFRGHVGVGAKRESNRHMELLRAAERDGVLFGGPVAKAEVAAAYAGWDALVLILAGGRYVSSGKVYEYMAAGLPIVSAHEIDHDASRLLTGHPLWTGAHGTQPGQLAAAFSSAARLAFEATDADRLAARRHGERFARAALLAPAIEAAADCIVTGSGRRPDETDAASSAHPPGMRAR